MPSSKLFLEAIYDTTKFVHERIVKQNTNMAEYANKSRIPHSFKIDNYVWLSTRNLSLEDGSGMRKLNSKFCGPFRISKKINDVRFRLELPHPMISKVIHDCFHCSPLKPFVSDKLNRYQKPLLPIQIANTPKNTK